MTDRSIELAERTGITTVYEQLCESYRAIDDFRPKLLAALPVASGTGIFLLIGKADENIPAQLLLPIGVFGFLATLGFFIFEIYSIRKCTHRIVLGKHLEEQLGVEGQFETRPDGIEGFLFPDGFARLISEPFASGVIYPAVLGAWAFVASYRPYPTASANASDLTKIASHDVHATGVAGILGVGVFIVGFVIALIFGRGSLVKDTPTKEKELPNTAESPASTFVSEINQHN